MDKVTRQCPQTTTFLKRKESEAVSNRGPSAYQPNALPLGHTGSLWWRMGRGRLYTYRYIVTTRMKGVSSKQPRALSTGRSLLKGKVPITCVLAVCVCVWGGGVTIHTLYNCVLAGTLCWVELPLGGGALSLYTVQLCTSCTLCWVELPLGGGGGGHYTYTVQLCTSCTLCWVELPLGGGGSGSLYIHCTIVY